MGKSDNHPLDAAAGTAGGGIILISQKECKNRNDLFKLMQENPDLPVLPMVDGEIPGDDCGYWLGAWGTSHLEEYLVDNGQVLFKSDDDVFDVLERFLPDDEYYRLPDVESECRKVYNALPWKKAIVVYITT